MAASRFIEEESGTYTGFRHPHNGYYAGDFSAEVSVWIRAARVPRRHRAPGPEPARPAVSPVREL